VGENRIAKSENQKCGSKNVHGLGQAVIGGAVKSIKVNCGGGVFCCLFHSLGV